MKFLINNFFFQMNLILKISLVKIDNPIEVRIINEMDANSSNRTNAELTYTPVIPILRE